MIIFSHFKKRNLLSGSGLLEKSLPRTTETLLINPRNPSHQMTRMLMPSVYKALASSPTDKLQLYQTGLVISTISHIRCGLGSGVLIISSYDHNHAIRAVPSFHFGGRQRQISCVSGLLNHHSGDMTSRVFGGHQFSLDNETFDSLDSLTTKYPLYDPRILKIEKQQ